MSESNSKMVQVGVTAMEYRGLQQPIQVLKSAAGFYLGTSENGLPATRVSYEYWRTIAEAEHALESGNWTRRRDC